MTEKLDITVFDTIKGRYYKETKMINFIKQIDKNINKYSKFGKYDDIDMSICYNACVYETDKNVYIVRLICNYDKEKYTYDEYSIDTNNFPQYSKIFKNYAEITRKNDFEKECYKKIENNNIGTTEENINYFKYLKKIKKCVNINNLNKILSLLAVPASFLALYATLRFNNPLVAGIFAFEGVRSIAKLPSILIGNYSSDAGAYNTYTASLLDSFRTNRLLSRKIKSILKKIGKKNEIINDNAKEVSKEDIYKDAVINYMNSIMTAANKLNSDDKKEVLYELRGILDEYTTKCQEINNDDGLSLSLNNSKSHIAKEAIDKLTSLQMKLADLIKKNNKNKTLLAENEKFRQAINESIESEEKGKKLTLARGK